MAPRRCHRENVSKVPATHHPLLPGTHVASRDPCRGGDIDYWKDGKAVPPKPAASAHPPGRNHVCPQLRPFSETPQAQARPARRGLGAGRTGHSSGCPHLVLVFLRPPLRGLDVGAGPPRGGLPLAKGSRYFPMGLTSAASPSPCPQPPAPGVSEAPPLLAGAGIQGDWLCSLGPTESLGI